MGNIEIKKNLSLMSEPPHLDVLPFSKDKRFSKAAQGNSLGSAKLPLRIQATGY